MPRHSKGQGIASRIVSLASRKPSPIRACIYGKSGTGKTTFACTFPKPLLLVGVEDGTRAVLGTKGVSFLPVAETRDVLEALDYADGKFRTVVLDTVTALEDMVLKEILGLPEVPVQKSWGMATRDQYGQCAMRVKEHLRRMLSLSCDAVVLAQEREFLVEDNQGAGDIIQPYVAAAVMPSVLRWLNPSVDFICQTYIRPVVTHKEIKVGKGSSVTRAVKTGRVEYCLRVRPDPVYVVKLRSPRKFDIPECLTDPTYNKFTSLIQGGTA